MDISVLRHLQYPEQDEEENRWRTHHCWKIAQKLIFETHKNEPLGAILLGKLKLNPIGLFLLVVFGVAFIQGSGLLVYTLISGLDESALIRFLYLQWHILLLYWVVVPSILAFYPWVGRTVGRLFAGLYIDGALTRDEKGLFVLVASVRDHICDKRWTYAAVSLTIVSLAILVYTGLIGQDWAGTPGIKFDIRLYYIIQLPGVGVAGYILYIIVAREIATVRSLFRLFNESSSGHKVVKSVHVRPWHPDRCGGLGRLNKYAIRFSYFIALVALGLSLFTYFSLLKCDYNIYKSLSTDPGLWAAIVAYVVLAPSLFFLTLGSAHRAMHGEKVESLRGISEQLDIEYEKTHRVYKKSSSILAASAEKVRLLHELYELTDKFPVWPFDTATIRRFATAWIAPFLIVALSVGIQTLVKFVIEMSVK